LGDIGVGGMAVPIGKLVLYTLAAGIHPSYTLPVALDIGTDNEELLRDPLYLGVGHKRIKGQEYDEFIDRFVKNVKQYFPKAILQWEDFNNKNAFDILERYQEEIPSYNDDIQSTGSVVLAGVINAVRIKQEKISDQVFTVFGAGSGGIGFARKLHRALIDSGLDEQTAYDKITLIDSKGVVISDRPNLEEQKKPFAVDPARIADWRIKGDSPDLLDVLTQTRSTVLVGISGQSGAFRQEHIDAMLSHTDRPIVFPLTNPPAESEVTPEQLYEWSRGRAIIAVGSRYPDLEYDGKRFRVGQASNAFIFPAIGMAAILSKIKIITDEMFIKAAYALADCVPKAELDRGMVYPQVKDLQNVAVRISVGLLKMITELNPHIGLKIDNIHEVIQSNIWKPMYHPYKRV
jgi:malate dehydrogenase (oxaloacetate-decarboxylating)